jgi:transposase-like protein
MNYCKGCGSSDLVKNGLSPEGAQKYKCKSCSGTSIDLAIIDSNIQWINELVW